MKLAICVQQSLFASVFAAALDAQGHDVMITTDDPRELFAAARLLGPDLCVIDAPPGAAETLHRLCPATAVVLLVEPQDQAAWDAYDAGTVAGVVSKSCSLGAVSEAVGKISRGERVAEGRPVPDRRRPEAVDPLTSRELEVLRLVVRGLSTEQMAIDLGVSRHTVRTHVQQVLRKLGVHDRGKIARAAAAAGLVDVRDLVEGRHR
jgi:DNA-binding NarL/FixJ family response regulator